MHHPPAPSAPSPPPEIAALAESLQAALDRAGVAVQCAWLFGSTARGEAGPMSDVDVAVLLDSGVPRENYLDAAAALVEELERSAPRIDLVVLNEAPPALRHRVILDGLLLLERDPRQRIDFEVRSIREALDFQHIAAIYDRALLERAAGGRLGT
ncbi:MAG TPA: nucleotidyltransferase domain-containing protein [Thermoanaerobaculia bacterium]|nr:nucleotidyltransferase domain-containing protein [Thermoanaerobaculia bacterium]